MLKKFSAVFFSIVMLFCTTSNSFAQSSQKMEYSTERGLYSGEKLSDVDNNTAKKGGKVIVLDLNRTSLSHMREIPYLNKIIEKSGYIGLMNIRGDKGYDDRRNYATFGSSGRADLNPEISLDFTNYSDDKGEIYYRATGKKPGEINLNNINQLDFYNKDKGDFKSDMGVLSDTLISAGKKVSAIGNSDYIDDSGDYVKNRDFLLSVMDSKGRIFYGDVDNIIVKDDSYPYSTRFDYETLKKESKDLYNKSDLLFVNLGDTYRLDKYKQKLNDSTYESMRKRIYKDIGSYIEYVFSMVSDKDTVYVMSSFPSDIDYKNNRRLAPVIRFDMSKMDSSGVLTSSTTRRKGVIANMDIGVDILSRFGLKNELMMGRTINDIDIEHRDEFLKKEYKKIISISNIRMDIINIYVAIIVVSWIMALLALWKRKNIPDKYRDRVLGYLKELVKFGMIMPLAFLSAPIFGSGSEINISLSIIGLSVFIYLVAKLSFKNRDIAQMGFFSLLMIFLITVDSVMGTPLMQGNIMSYDPMIGARYYGIGNEYEGVTIGSAIIGFAVLLEYKKLPKWIVGILMMAILFISAYPGMGANVGGAISECIAYITFILLIYNVRVDIKRVILILLATAGLVGVFAGLDLYLGLGSHLGNFVMSIVNNGPMEVIYVFGRKIAMNVQLAQTTVWVNILISAIVVLGIVIFKPNKEMSDVKEKYPIVYKGFLSAVVGCFVTMLVNDSGIIAAATDSIYLLIPLLMIIMNEKMGWKEDNA